MIADNINMIMNKYPNLWQKIKNQNESINKNLITVENSKSGKKTLRINLEDKKQYLHSKYDPIKEAEKILESFKDKKIDNDTHIIFYGLGLGYHINILLEKHPNTTFSFYEPVPEVFFEFLEYNNITNLHIKNLDLITFENNEEEKIEFFKNILRKKETNIMIIDLPAYKNIFSEKYNEFFKNFQETIKNRRTGVHANYSMQKKWIMNSMINFKKTLTTPNILLEKKKYFEGKTAILASAGPSLEEEIENLKHIKENGLAYIFSVGSAVNTLIYYSVFPHALTTYDPREGNMKVFNKIIDRDIKNIPLIYGSSVYYNVIDSYPNEKIIHMITSQDTLSNFYLKPKNENEKVEFVMDAPSIAVVTLQMLYKLRFSKIIFVGQNLAFKDDKDYAGGIDYYEGGKSNYILKGDHIKTKDVTGKEIYTNQALNSMKRQLEFHIKNYKSDLTFSEVQLINSTKGGAHIEGTIFKPLEDVIKEDLKESVYDETWFKFEGSGYDLDYLLEKSNLVNKDFNKVTQLINELEDILKKMYKLSQNQNYKQIDKMYSILNHKFNEIRDNTYFKLFIIPMNRLEYEIMVMEINKNHLENDKKSKVMKLIESFGKFMHLCKKDYKQSIPIFSDVNKAIEELIEMEKKV